MPSDMVACLPYFRVRAVTNGDTTIAAEKLKPPMKAKSIGVASGKVSLLR